MVGPTPVSPGARIAAVVVDYRAGEVLVDCVDSLVAEGIATIVVVDNAVPPHASATLGAQRGVVELIETGANLGYGGGINRGVAAAGDFEFILVTNPDIVVHQGAAAALVGALDEQPGWGIVSPMVLTPAGERYPSARRFPSAIDAAAHALLGPFWKTNPFSARYLDATVDGLRGEPDWVSGSCFVIRRSLFETLGGFDEAFFMFAEDMDLCWRARKAGAAIGVCDTAVVTHVEGVSRSHRPRAMLAAHHRSAFRFEAKTTSGWRRLALPVAAVVLSLRFFAVVAFSLFKR